MKKPDPIFNDLRRHQVKTAGEMLAAVYRAKKELREKIKDAKGKDIVREDFRRAFFGQVSGVYDLLSQELDEQLKDATAITANQVREAAITRIRAAKKAGGAVGSVSGIALKFDPDRMRRYWELIHPANGASLAAVFTERMAREDIDSLRAAVITVTRQGDLQAWTANERQKQLQDAWDAAAGDLNPSRFIAKDGKEWTNARYLQMLVRTTQARVHREAYIDTVVEHGDDLMRIVTHGENCKTCDAWAGLIISITGTNPNYPSYDDALEAGWGHPNDDCTLERVDEELDAEDAGAQGDAKNPDDWADLEAVQEYRERAGLEEEEEAAPKTDFADEVEAAFLGEVDG